MRLRPSTPADLGFVTTLERRPEHLDAIGQWSDAEHLSAIAGENGREHWIIERGGVAAGYLIAFDCRHAGIGFYVKRILVGDKERGTGSQALAQFDERVFGMPGVESVWLIVRSRNFRAQHVYRKLGFVRFEPTREERPRYDSIQEGPSDEREAFRMRLARGRA